MRVRRVEHNSANRTIGRGLDELAAEDQKLREASQYKELIIARGAEGLVDLQS
jgi:hypothetical protein